jgi:hypothetical protein
MASLLHLSRAANNGAAMAKDRGAKATGDGVNRGLQDELAQR